MALNRDLALHCELALHGDLALHGAAQWALIHPAPSAAARSRPAGTR